MDDYDAIVIGSGMGGLTTAVLLTKLAGKRVAVLESHFRLGGFTHTFTRKQWHWDVGIHYLGQLHEGATTRALMDYVTGGSAKFAAMPHVYDVFHYPEHTVRVPADQGEYLDELDRQFPGHRTALEGYFRDIRRAAGWAGRTAYSFGAPLPLKVGLTAAGLRDRRLATMTTKAYLEAHIPDQQLRAVLASQWGDYGLPPGQSAFGMHALVVAHFLRGGYYPAGSSRIIAEGAREIIEAGGGACLVNHRVEQVLIEGGRAVGVRVAVKKGRTPQRVELRAPLVISDAGAQVTATRLIPDGVGSKLRAAVAGAQPGVSTVTLYLGLRDSPEALGFHGENHWYFTGYDHDLLRERWPLTLEGRPPGAFLSFPSLKDPDASSHTAEIIAFVESGAFEPWAGELWRRRGEDYEALKLRIADGLLDLVESHHPGFRELVAFRELSTPLTVADFTGHAGGQIYGLPATPDRYRRRISAVTDVPGLLLTGADLAAPGVAGALIGGVFAAASVLGPTGYPRIMREVTSRAKVSPPS